MPFALNLGENPILALALRFDTYIVLRHAFEHICTLSYVNDLIINLEQWVQGKMYDRLGLEEQTTDILGIQIPSILIPVRPGRNLALIIEIATMNMRQKQMGFNTAVELNEKLMKQMGEK